MKNESTTQQELCHLLKKNFIQYARTLQDLPTFYSKDKDNSNNHKGNTTLDRLDKLDEETWIFLFTNCKKDKIPLSSKIEIQMRPPTLAQSPRGKSTLIR